MSVRESRLPVALAKCDLAHISGKDRSQPLLLPDAVEGYIGPDKPVCFIDSFVDGIDLSDAGFKRVQSAPTDGDMNAPCRVHPRQGIINRRDTLSSWLYGRLPMARPM